MVKYLISAVNTVRVHNVADVELVQCSYTTKDIKVKREVVDQYQLVKYKVIFTDEKEPEAQFEVEYNEV